MNNIFQVDWDALVRMLCYVHWRKAPFLQWLETLVSQVAMLHLQFLTYSELKRRELSYNSQTMLFERALNDRFDNDLRRISISNEAQNVDYLYMYHASEWQTGAEPTYIGFIAGEPSGTTQQIGPVFLSWWSEYIAPVGFIVHVPNVYSGLANAINQLVERYKFAGIKHAIKFFIP